MFTATRLRWLVPVALLGFLSTLRQILLTLNEGRGRHR